ncbi:MAG: GIY-YIG nuclease family protein [Gammaproteobacteria bacterium]|nr:GIY-YIG nuclease family protein [Gammaproteobacteria bacterium]
MLIRDILGLLSPHVDPNDLKIHLATWNGSEDPLDVYLAHEFDEWQRWQTRKNFERSWVISLISLPAKDTWLFSGLYRSCGCVWNDECGLYYYDLRPDDDCEELRGRLIVNFTRSGRQAYLNGQRWMKDLHMSEILPKPLTIGEFPGFKAVNLTKSELDIIVHESAESWRTALMNVAGVYLISDLNSGKLYVGSASGEGGIWERWQAYSETGHGGNVELRQLLLEKGAGYARHFRFSVLEIADTHASRDDVLTRESHWKDVLQTRGFGLNAIAQINLTKS